MPEAWLCKAALAGGGCTRVHPYNEIMKLSLYL